MRMRFTENCTKEQRYLEGRLKFISQGRNTEKKEGNRESRKDTKSHSVCVTKGLTYIQGDDRCSILACFCNFTQAFHIVANFQLTIQNRIHQNLEEERSIPQFGIKIVRSCAQCRHWGMGKAQLAADK